MAEFGFPEYDGFDAVGLAEAIARGDVSAEEALNGALERLAVWEPHLNAIVFDMTSTARTAVASGLPDGPFRGVPFVLKDLGTRCTGTPTTYGSFLFKDNFADHDSELVRRYKAAGLNLIGKSAAPEFGLTTSTESRLFGETHNPWNPTRTPGGSSGGSSALVAAGVIPAADSSDGGGSIRIPASCCGLVGLKPSRGAISMAPDAGEGWSGMSTSGVISRSVRDTAALLDAIVGNVSGDPYLGPNKTRAYGDELATPLEPLRIAFHATPYNGAQVDPVCAEACREVATFCESLGHRVEEKALTYDTERLNRAVRIVVASQTRRTVDDRLKELGRELNREADLEPLTLAVYDSAERYTAADYVFAINTMHDAGRVSDRFLNDFDLVLTPTMGIPPHPLGDALSLSHPDSKAFGRTIASTVCFTQFYNVTGQPAISLPLSWSADGLPLGAQFAARFGHEALLLRLAAQLENARPWDGKRPSLPA